ncbi:ParB/RepB/Spo0J family partition protein [Azohydromonas caseinilytica]|uniref:ParB/RepB/Spo0J family partition protein n=1 Tax=Azohydromonas caseinilytica TaxID=2728836 RepID=A0A848FH96_9BURK|nr:ParB/RepB/Spo0J family partition protein [Azohydromonas caseinilytica]NML18848.1 ParB/RepB/Spo0J family partition protein [Azohydromonas caseinilytica]
MTKKIAEKSKLVNLLPDPEPPMAPPAAVDDGLGQRKAYTGVGQMMGVLGRSSPLGKELAEVKARLREYEGSVPLKLLDPRTITRSRLANRHESEFESEDFARLKGEIEHAGVNVQPVKVRPLEPPRDGVQYELVFGHRRHRACLELGVPVLAMIESVSDKLMWLTMDRENRERRNLSPWEQGQSIQRALQAGLFSSIRRLAEESGMDHSNAAKALRLAELPAAVVAAFNSPADIQLHWARPLSEALQQDPEGVLARAKSMAARGTVPRAPKAVLDELLGHSQARGVADKRQLKKDGKTVAVLSQKAGGGLAIEIRQPVDMGEVESLLKKLLRL